MANFDLFNRDGVQCPVCLGYLGFLAITDTPPMDGIEGNVVICQLCAAFSVAIKIGNGQARLRPMHPEEKVALRQHPTAPLMKAFQEDLAFRIGGSD